MGWRKRGPMSEAEKSALKFITGAAATATILAVLMQVLIGAIWFGSKLEQKADAAVVEEIRQEWADELQHHEVRFQEHCSERAEIDGLLSGELNGINKRLDDIIERLPK